MTRSPASALSPVYAAPDTYLPSVTGNRKYATRRTPAEITDGLIAACPWLALRRGAVIHAFACAMKQDREDPLPATDEPNVARFRAELLWWRLVSTRARDTEYFGTTSLRFFRHFARKPEPSANGSGCLVWKWRITTVFEGVSWIGWQGEAFSQEAARRQSQIATARLKAAKRDYVERRVSRGDLVS